MNVASREDSLEKRDIVLEKLRSGVALLKTMRVLDDNAS